MIRRLIPALFAAAFLALPLPAPAQDSPPRPGGLSELQRREIEALIGEYIHNHPEVILESVRNMQNREQAGQLRRRQDALASRRDDIERDPTSPVAGNSAGDVTLVEFFDYRCSYCKTVFPAVQRLLREDPKVRYVLKELPILSPESRIAARLALAVWNLEPKRYFALHTKLMEARGDLTQARIFEIARDAGVDVQRARREMDSPEIERALAKNMELASALGINGTPGFIVGRKLVPGATDFDTLKRLVEEARRGG